MVGKQVDVKGVEAVNLVNVPHLVSVPHLCPHLVSVPHPCPHLVGVPHLVSVTHPCPHLVDDPHLVNVPHLVGVTHPCPYLVGATHPCPHLVGATHPCTTTPCRKQVRQQMRCVWTLVMTWAPWHTMMWVHPIDLPMGTHFGPHPWGPMVPTHPYPRCPPSVRLPH